MQSRDVIACAKGLIMQQFGMDRDRAWDLLVRLSQNLNLRVEAIAARLVAAHEERTAQAPQQNPDDEAARRQAGL